MQTNTYAAAAPTDPIARGPVTTPAAWYGFDLARQDDWIFRFGSEDLQEIDRAVASFAASGRPLEHISAADFSLPGLQPRLRALRQELLEGRGFTLLRGLRVEGYTAAQTAIAYMGIGAHFGAPRSQNAAGHLLGHVKDTGLDIADPRVRYYQTNRRLEYHTDSVDIVGLLCLKTAMSGGESFIVSSITCYNEILRRRPDLLPLLLAPFPTDRRGEVPEGMLPWFELPVYSWFEGRLSAIYARQYIDSAQENFPDAPRLNGAQWEALDLLTALVNDGSIHLKMSFEPGDIQLLHNHQILHSRSDFVNWPEPERHRHLLRLWLCPDNGRPLPPAFAIRYGSVTPGDRGGIVVKGTRPTVPIHPE